MYLLTFLEILGCAALSIYLINQYAHNSVKNYVKIVVLVSWVMNFTLILLVPLDIYINVRNYEQKLIPEDDPAF